MTRIAVAVNEQEDGYQSGQQAVQAALDDLGPGGISLTLVFTSHPNPRDVLHGARATLGPVPLIGATTAGQYTHDRYADQGTGVMLIQSDDIQFHPFEREQPWRARGNLLHSLQGLSESGLGSSFNHRALLLFADDQSMDLDQVLERSITETRMLYEILGGTGVTTHKPPRPAWLFHNEVSQQAGLTGAELLSQRPIGMALADGWLPVSGPYRVTKVDEKRIVQLDGRPVREVYEDFFEEHGITLSNENAATTILHYPLGICRNPYCKAHVLVDFDPMGALITYAPPSEGSLVYILSTTPEAMIGAASRAIEQAQIVLGKHRTAGVLFIDCLSNGLILDDMYVQQRQAVQHSMKGRPFLGIRSRGVLVRLSGQTSGYYQCSVAACLFAE